MNSIEYVNSIENLCSVLPQKDKDYFKNKIYGVLKSAKTYYKDADAFQNKIRPFEESTEELLKNLFEASNIYTQEESLRILRALFAKTHSDNVQEYEETLPIFTYTL